MLVSRHPKAVYFHAALQTFAYLVFAIAAGLGIWMAKKVHSVSLFCTVLLGRRDGLCKRHGLIVVLQINDYHPIIGLVILGLCGLQLLSGLKNYLLCFRLLRVAYLA